MSTSKSTRKSSLTTRSHYSDKKLTSFKSLVEERLEKELTNLREFEKSFQEGDEGNSTGVLKMKEKAMETMTKIEHGRMVEQKKKFIECLQNALLRIKNKTYGICRVTGALIPEERLKLVPHVTTSIEGKAIEEAARRFPLNKKPVYA